jgi:hypothetical protein
MSWRSASSWLLLLLLFAAGGIAGMSLVLLREASVVIHHTRPYLHPHTQVQRK